MESNLFEDMVSIITPTYNSERYIEETIKSVKHQTYTNWEMIIVDDNSNDGTVSIIEREIKKDNRIKLVKQKKNSGAAASRNLAIGIAKGNYIAFLDSDDLWEPNKLEIQLKYMKKNDIPFSFTSYKVISENGDTLKTISVPYTINYKQLLKNTIIGCLTVVLDIKKIGKIRMPDIRTRQDTALWLSILKKGHTAYGIQKPLAKYRKVSGSLSSNKFHMLRKNWYLYRNIENLGFFYSLWCFINYVINAIHKRI